MKKLLLGLILFIGVQGTAQVVTSQSGDVLGVHNLGAMSSPVSGPNTNACLYCHAPHSARSNGPLWTQQFSTQTYSLYTSDTIQNVPEQPELGRDSTLCLSCHDGTVAPGQTSPSGQIKLSGTMTSMVGTKLESSHPFSLRTPLQDAPNLVSSLAATQKTADPTDSVKLIDGTVECTSCHNAHIQRIDPVSAKFLARDNKNGALCLSCHETNARVVNNRSNTLAQWTASAHATSVAQVAPAAGLGGYTTMAEFACLSCHVTHNAGGAAGLLRNPSPAMVDVDTTSQSCFKCHDGSNSLVQPIPNVLAEFRKPGHPFATAGNAHTTTEPAVLNQNRHTTCADCHNAHSSKQTVTFDQAPDIRPAQNGAAGVGLDGNPLTTPATRQYETCLRCHGPSTGKQSLPIYGYLPARLVSGSDPTNLIPQFGTSAVSAHPVMRDRGGQAQPSLLASMWDLTGTVQKRAMGTRVFCTDCHNSDQSRESGGTAPNGPHGSNNPHILERRYVASQVAVGTFPTGGPGTLIMNLNPMVAPFPQLDPTANGPYALCAKCHNLQNVMSNASFVQHRNHVERGISCSVCHSSHGVPAGSASLTGRRLINFDANVVAPNKGVLSYNNSTCVLRCHMADHDPNGKVKPAN